MLFRSVGPDLVEYFRGREDIELMVFTQETARDKIYGYRSTEAACARLQVRCLNPNRLDDVFIQTVRGFGPELIVSAYYPKIFPAKLLEIPRLGAVNVHPGNLPNYRGRFAIPWTILNGEQQVTVSMHYLDDKVDAGDVLVTASFPVLPDETGFQLYLRAMHEAGKLLMASFDDLISGRLKGVPQIGYGSYFTHLEPRCHVIWQNDGRSIERQVRVHAKPYLPAFCYLLNHCFYINRATFSQPSGVSARSVGVIVQVEQDGRFSVSCSNGVIRVEDFDVYPAIDDSSLGEYIRVGARFE